MRKRRIEPCRVIREVKAAANPNGTDSSSPKFRDDRKHLLGILAAHGGGFPWIPAKI